MRAAIIYISLEVAILVACLFLWATLWYLFFRYSRAETKERLNLFLAKHVLGAKRSLFPSIRRSIALNEVRRRVDFGWSFFPLAFITIAVDFNVRSFILANSLLLFGGLFIAYSWYGQRCMRLLGLKVYALDDAIVVDATLK